jgi:flagellar basal body-associated protein FliL
MEPTIENKSNGSLIGVLVIILIIVLGGIYFFMSQNNTTTQEEINTEVPTNTETTNEDQTSAVINSLEGLENELENAIVEVDVNVDSLE